MRDALMTRPLPGGKGPRRRLLEAPPRSFVHPTDIVLRLAFAIGVGFGLALSTEHKPLDPSPHPQDEIRPLRRRSRTVMRMAASVSFVVLASLQIAAAQLLPTRAPGCPPSKTWTTGPDEGAGLVLAEGDLAPVRIAGPFEMPWAVAPLPDGSLLVTELPGRLQHVRSNAETNAVAGIPSVFYSEHGGLLDVEVDPEFGKKPSRLSVLSPRGGEGLDHPRGAREVR